MLTFLFLIIEIDADFSLFKIRINAHFSLVVILKKCSHLIFLEFIKIFTFVFLINDINAQFSLDRISKNSHFSFSTINKNDHFSLFNK